MAIPVVQLGTGNVGLHSLRALITNPEFELTGVWVSSDAKAGKDAAELAGFAESTGVKASTDLDAVLASGSQCAVYNAMADNRLPEALDDYRRVLAAGVNIVGSGPVFLQYPWQVLPDELVKPLEDAARKGNSSLYVSGIDPASPTTCFRWHSRVPVRASSRSAARRSSTTPPTTAPSSCSTSWDSESRSTRSPCCYSPGCSVWPGVRWSASLRRVLAFPSTWSRRCTCANPPRTPSTSPRSHSPGQRRRAALRSPRIGRRSSCRGARTRHPATRGSVPRLAPARPARRVLPDRDHR